MQARFLQLERRRILAQQQPQPDLRRLTQQPGRSGQAGRAPAGRPAGAASHLMSISVQLPGGVIERSWKDRVRTAYNNVASCTAQVGGRAGLVTVGASPGGRAGLVAVGASPGGRGW
jgi:hypothetical protein